VKDARDIAVTQGQDPFVGACTRNLAGWRGRESPGARHGAAVAVGAVGLGVFGAALALPAPAGLVALATFALVAVGVAARLPRRPRARFGPANAVTVVRAGGAAVFMGLAFAPDLLAGVAAWAAAAAATALLALDGLDGWLAKRSGLASAFGARFDMETDALFILALSAVALALGKAGPWVLALGAMRYAFVAAGWVWPRLAGPLPPSFRRKAVCVLQVAALAVLLTPPAAPPVSDALAGVALAALAVSFAVDLRWLIRTPS